MIQYASYLNDTPSKKGPTQMDDREYQRRCDAISGLINQLRYARAETAARQLAEAEPTRVEAVVLWNLAACCNGAAQDHTTDIIRIAEDRGASPITIGDMLRDQGKLAITYGWLDVADTALHQAELLHRDDLNRLACLQGIRARWHFARGERGLAVMAHIAADQAWFCLGNRANQEWVLNNLTAMTQALAALNEQTAQRVIAASAPERGWRHVVLCGINVTLPIAGWRFADRLIKARR